MSKPFIHLVLFLSRATPLGRWEQMGILIRELAVYRNLFGWIYKFSIVTCGGRAELSYQEHIPGAQILYNRWNLSPNAYSILAPWLHASHLRQATLYKTNQLDGAWSAILSGKIFHKPVIVRAGYLWAETNRLVGNRGIKTSFIDRLQAFSISQADALVLTTEAIQKYINQIHPITSKKTFIIPNAVDIDTFKLIEGVKQVPGQICFVGRLVALKNIDVLIEALSSIPGTQLVVIGEGEEQQKLIKLAHLKQLDVHFLGQIPNDRIPIVINHSQLFVLPSSSEGNPKALIEAMACGAAVIGADVPGIREIIKHGKTGWLSSPDIETLRNDIKFLLSNPALCSELGKNARQFIIENFSLEHITQLEKFVIKQTIQGFYGRFP